MRQDLKKCVRMGFLCLFLLAEFTPQAAEAGHGVPFFGGRSRRAHRGSRAHRPDQNRRYEEFRLQGCDRKQIQCDELMRDMRIQLPRVAADLRDYCRIERNVCGGGTETRGLISGRRYRRRKAVVEAYRQCVRDHQPGVRLQLCFNGVVDLAD